MSSLVVKKRGFAILIVSVIMLLIGAEEVREYYVDKLELGLVIAVPLLTVGTLLLLTAFYFIKKEKGI